MKSSEHIRTTAEQLRAMAEPFPLDWFIAITLAVLIANLMAGALFYCLILISRGENRRALSVFAASMMSAGGIGLTVWLTLVAPAAHGMAVAAAVSLTLFGGVWLVYDMAFPFQPPRSRKQPEPSPPMTR